MKHDNSFLLIIFLLLAGCGQKDRAKSQFESSVQTEESYPLAKEYIKEAVITGKVLNRDFYPQERELTLIIPFFWKMENQYRTPIHFGKFQKFSQQWQAFRGSARKNG